MLFWLRKMYKVKKNYFQKRHKYVTFINFYDPCILPATGYPGILIKISIPVLFDHQSVTGLADLLNHLNKQKYV